MPQPVRADLADHLVCSWTATVGGNHALVPDGCVDLLWTSHGTIRVCGPETHGWTISQPPGTRALGVRFRPGVVAGLMRINVAELRDRRVAAEDLLGTRSTTRLLDSLDAAGSDQARIALLESEITDWLAHVEHDDLLARDVARALAQRSWDISSLATATSLTQRQLQRRCRVAFGYGPSTLRAVLRLQRFMALARRSPPATLTDLAHRAGFSDHAHLARDCRTIAGLTPTALLAGQAPDWHGTGTPWWAAPNVRSVQATRCHQRAPSRA